MKKGRFLFSLIPLLIIAFICLSVPVLAGPVDSDAAGRAASGWLRQNPVPMNTAMADQVASIHAFAGAKETLYYAVSLEPEGFVIVSADDELEPVVAFCSRGRYVSDPANPLTALLEQDLAGRKEALRLAKKAGTLAKERKEKQSKWDTLLVLSKDDSPLVTKGLGGLSDVRVSPLLESQWDQGDAYGGPCYNYYTPNHYPTGCVATAMAQVIRYYEYPTAGIGYLPYTIYVSGSSQTTYTLGGNGAGGPYVWSLMPPVPTAAITTAQRQAIGALCHDVGASVHMNYGSLSSSASLSDAKEALLDVFDYSDAVYGIGQYGNNLPSATLHKMINPGLDASMPSILGVTRTGGGHAVIADGYGYQSGTLYHHINMGWGGSDNVWYALPLIDAYHTYTSVNECIYNVYTSGGGEIISGRILSQVGLPVEGVMVSAYYGAALVRQATSNAKGIYALAGLTSSRTYSVRPTKAGYNITARNVSVGSSQDNYSYQQPVCGNVWGADFTAESAGPPVAYDQTFLLTDANDLYIPLLATDDGLPNPPGALEYTLTSLPEHGRLYDPNVGEILTVPYVLEDPDHRVWYVPCAYYNGTDDFSFTVHDGAGASDPAVITVNIDRSTEITVESSVIDQRIINEPLQASAHDGRTQVIYNSSEVGGARLLTDLALNVYTVPGGTLNNFRIRMKHTPKSKYNTVSDNFENTGWTEVYLANETFTQTGWYTFHFQTPFAYDGINHLMIDFLFDNTSSVGAGVAIFCLDHTNDVRIFCAESNSSHGDPRYWTKSLLGGISYYSGGFLSLKLKGVPLAEPLEGDISCDCRVNLRDLALLSRAWMSSLGDSNYDPACDISPVGDNQITLDDLGVVAENWMTVYGQ